MTNLNKGEFEVYDRQLRLWGFEAQQRMKESQILVIGLTNCCTELARHLTLSGINVQLVAYDKSLLVQDGDFMEDFLLSQEDVGKKKGEVIVRKLAEMNPFCKVEFSEVENIRAVIETNKKISAIVYGLTGQNLKEAIGMNNIAREHGLPFYCLNSSGLSAFIFADLGVDKFEFQYKKKDAEGNETQIISDVKGSKTLEQYFKQLENQQVKLAWKKRDILKPNKMLLLSILGEKISAVGSASDEDHVNSLFAFIDKKAGLSAHSQTLKGSAEFKSHVLKFHKLFAENVEFNPCSSLIGAITSQEIIKVITKKDFPEHGFYLYDTNSQRMVIEKV